MVYSAYMNRILWSLLALFLAIETTIATSATHRKRQHGRFMLEFDRHGDNADAHRDSSILLDQLKDKFPEVHMTMPSILNYDVIRAATLQIDKKKTNLHDAILQAAKDSGLVTEIHPLHRITQAKKAAIPSPLPKNIADHTQKHHHLKRSLKNVVNQKLLMAHSMTQVEDVHNEGNTGQGIHIAILDDGVDYTHPALGGGFGPGFKISGGWDFVGVPELQVEDDSDDFSGHQPDDDPLDDCGKYGMFAGHGTHVSGIIGAVSDEPYYRGVAPDAELSMYRILDCTGKTDTATIVAGLARASESGADIISMSVGSIGGWAEALDAVTAERIVTEKGIPVIVSAGNEGEDGVFSIGAPSTGLGVISVASVDNDYKMQDTIIVDGFEDAIDINLSLSERLAIPDGDLVFGAMKVGSETDACTPNDVPRGVRGRLAIIQAGTCDFDVQVDNLYRKGAISVLIFNTKESGDDVLEPYTTNVTIPIAGLSYNSGVAISRALVKQGQRYGKKRAILSVESSGRVVPVKTAGRISEFSSIGPSYENHFKPNIAGVGGFMYSTYPQYMGSWQTLNGTSMSTPYFAGAFALYLKAMRDDPRQAEQSPAYMLEQFQNHASKVPSWSEQDVFLSPVVQSAGLVQVYDAIHQKTHVTPSTISCNDTVNFIKSHTLTITNEGETTVEYDIINHRSESILPYNITNKSYLFNQEIDYVNDMTADIEFSYEAIRLLPGQYIEVDLTVTPPDANPEYHLLYGGFILFKDRSENKKDLTVPYIGIVGDQRELPLFSPGLPAFVEPDYSRYPKNVTIILDRTNNENATTPGILSLLAAPTKRMNYELYSSATDKRVGYIFPSDKLLPRLSWTQDDPKDFMAYWDGSYYTSADDDSSAKTFNVESGTYYIVISALKLLGDPHNPKHWENWKLNDIQVI